MDKKKEYGNQLYMPLYVVFLLVLASIFLVCFSGIAKAVTQDEILSALTQFKENYPENGRRYEEVISVIGSDLQSLASDIYSHYLVQNKVTVANQNVLCLYVHVPTNGGIQFYLSSARLIDNRKICRVNRDLAVMNNPNSYVTSYYFFINNGQIVSENSDTKLYGFTYAYNYDFLMLFPINDVYASFSDTTTSNLNDMFSFLFNNNGGFKGIVSNFSEPNGITIQANDVIKYHANIGNQAVINVTGKWYINQFKYYIQRKENGVYHTLSDECDYSLIEDHVYNSAYLYCKNLNYLPYGTYRFIATSEAIGVSTFSNDFSLTYEQSISGGTATGTIDKNGNVNIDVNIDNGEIIDNIKDYLGQPADTTEDDFKDNFPTVEIEDPSEDFFSWIFDNIENIFTSTSPEFFEFSLYTDNVYRVSSNDIKVPNGVIKNLIGLSCDFSICYWIMKDIRKVVNKIKEGSIETLGDDDITANMV